MEKVKTKKWDSAEFLTSEKEGQAYLNACFEEYGDDPAMIAHAFGVVARARGMSKVAKKAGLTRESFYKALSAEGNPRVFDHTESGERARRSAAGCVSPPKAFGNPSDGQ